MVAQILKLGYGGGEELQYEMLQCLCLIKLTLLT